MSEKQQFPTMLGPKPKPFNCAVCHQEHTHGSWEDIEVFFSDKMSTHLGCLQSHYKELLLQGKLALANAESFLLLLENLSVDPETISHFKTTGTPIIRDIITNLKGALRDE